MDDSIVWQNSNDAVANPLVANTTDPFLANDDTSVSAALTTRNAVPKQEEGLGVDQQSLPQALHDTAFG